MGVLLALLWLAGPAEPAAGPPQFKVVDIVFKIEDLETKVSSLEVKETDTEVRIELAADVLFDFDKSDILPKAEATLKQVAESSANGARAVSVSKAIPIRKAATPTIKSSHVSAQNRSFPGSARSKDWQTSISLRTDSVPRVRSRRTRNPMARTIRQAGRKTGASRSS